MSKLAAAFLYVGLIFFATADAAKANPEYAIETQIYGEFNGWEGETIVRLYNGQIWQQIEPYYWYYYAYMPKVLLFKTQYGWKMLVNGIEHPVGVQRIR